MSEYTGTIGLPQVKLYFNESLKVNDRFFYLSRARCREIKYDSHFSELQNTSKPRRTKQDHLERTFYFFALKNS